MNSRRKVMLTLMATCCMVLGSIGPVMAQAPSSYPALGKIIRTDSGINDLIGLDARIEVLAAGMDWSEGPVWIQGDGGGYLLFSDIPRNSVMKWQQEEGLTVFMKPSGFTGVAGYGGEPGSNGLVLDPQGRIIFCEHGDRRLSVLTSGGGKRTLADNYKGKRFNSPNDAAVKSNGDIYFTDPPYGLANGPDDPKRELDYCGVFRLSKSGKVDLLTKELTRPNGIAFSPDEKTLYVAQSDRERPIIMAFPVKSNGLLGKGKVFHDFADTIGKLPGAPDGLKLDVHGNLFATAPGGVSILTPQGKLLGRIDTGERTANCAWGDDGSVLYMTADMYLCRIKTKTKGDGWK